MWRGGCVVWQLWRVVMHDTLILYITVVFFGKIPYLSSFVNAVCIVESEFYMCITLEIIVSRLKWDDIRIIKCDFLFTIMECILWVVICCQVTYFLIVHTKGFSVIRFCVHFLLVVISCRIFLFSCILFYCSSRFSWVNMNG